MQVMLEKLRDLQELLSEKIGIEEELAEKPRAHNTRKELLNRMKQNYLDKNRQVEEIKMKLRNLALEHRTSIEEKEVLEAKMHTVQNQREYEALDREITQKVEKEQVLKKQTTSEEMKQQELVESLEREELLIKNTEEELQKEEASIHSIIEEKSVLLDDLKEKQKAVSEGLEEELIFKFERIIRNKKGIGIVPITKGVCPGCHMILPIQFINDVRKGEKILFCPYCSRVLYFDEEGNEGEGYVFKTGDSTLSFNSMEESGTDDDDIGALSDIVGDFDLDDDMD